MCAPSLTGCPYISLLKEGPRQQGQCSGKLVVDAVSAKLSTSDDTARHPLRTYFIISLIVFLGLTAYGLWHGLLI